LVIQQFTEMLTWPIAGESRKPWMFFHPSSTTTALNETDQASSKAFVSFFIATPSIWEAKAPIWSFTKGVREPARTSSPTLWLEVEMLAGCSRQKAAGSRQYAARKQAGSWQQAGKQAAG
jgi:hypothetical protein